MSTCVIFIYLSYGMSTVVKMCLKSFYHVTSEKSLTGVQQKSEFINHTKTEFGVKLFGAELEAESKKSDSDYLWHRLRLFLWNWKRIRFRYKIFLKTGSVEELVFKYAALSILKKKIFC